MKYQEEDKTSQANTSADSHSGSLIISTESLFSLSQYDDVNTNINSFTFIGHEDCSSIDRNTTKSNKLGSAFNCPALNQLSSNGSINITSREGKTFISKIQQVYIEDNYKKLFEKGKHKLGDYSLYDSTLPDIHFWYRRYYYYTKFQEGIQMDYESNNAIKIIIIRLVLSYPRANSKIHRQSRQRENYHRRLLRQWR